jgi:hypothetical protein
MVDLALASVALVVFARIQRHPLAATTASSKYYQLLQLARVKISALTEQNVDACLLTVFLMGRYEGVALPNYHDSLGVSFESMHNWSHHDGAMAILRTWHDIPSRKTATSIIKHTRRDVIRSCILRGMRVPKWLLNGQVFGETGLEAHCDGITVRIANLYSATRLLQQKTHPLISEAVALNNEARALDNLLVEWAGCVPSSWAYQQHQLADPGPLPKRHFYSSTVYSFSNHGIGAIWCQYFATRMFLSSLRLKILHLNYPTASFSLTFELQRLKYNNSIKSMSTNVAATIPFCLDRFEVSPGNTPSENQMKITIKDHGDIEPHLATLVVWSLGLGASLEEIGLEQRQWFQAELAHLGRVTGAGVLECAETHEWATL